MPYLRQPAAHCGQGSYRTIEMLLCLAVPLATLSALACSDFAAPPNTPEPVASYRQVVLPTGKLPTLDDAFESLVAEAPGFGGLFYDPDGRLTVYLKDPSLRESVQPAIESFLAHGKPNPSAQLRDQIANMVVLRGGFDYRELASSYRLLTPLFATAGVTMTDIDEMENRIVIGVIDDDARSRFLGSLTRLSLPTGIVDVELSPPVLPMRAAPSRTEPIFTPDCISCQNINLQGIVRPITASTRIESAAEGCSIGMNVYFRDNTGTYDGEKYFITASHCSASFWDLDGGWFGQPDATHKVADEVADPPGFTNASNSACPSPFTCRYSDASLARIRPGIGWRHGYIPLIDNSEPFQITGFTQITYTDPQWGTAPDSIYAGIYLKKTGATTGMSPGHMRRTCVGIHGYEAPDFPTNAFYLCQFQANELYNDVGDSGAAIYAPNSAGWADPIVGILWGIQYDNNVFGNVTVTTFSHPWYAITELVNAFGGGWLDAGLGACGTCGY